MRNFSWKYAITLSCCLLSLRPAVDAQELPNIVLILADDMGWGDPECYQADSKIPTPNLNRLAREGMRFTDAHTPSSVCTPTRYTLLTGRYCWRTSLKKGVLDGFGPPLIQPGEMTLASLLEEEGYRTACIGKWHLGMQWYTQDGEAIKERGPQRFRSGANVDFSRDVEGGPLDVGFERFFGISASLDMAPYCYLQDRRVTMLPTDFHEERKGTLFLNGVSGVKSPDFSIYDVLGRFGDEAVDFITERRKRIAPLFLYLPLNSPHLPISPASEAKGKSRAGEYGDFVWETDQVVGRVLEALDDMNMTENTLVIFTSDNGGLWHWWDFAADDDGGEVSKSKRGESIREFNHQSNADWRGTKADIYEGGHRVPFLVRWPAVVGAGQVSDSLVELTDVFATVAEIVGQEDETGNSGMDSFSFLPVLKDPSKTTRPVSVHHSLSGMFALRDGDWKFIEGRGSGGFTRPRNREELTGDSEVPLGQLYHLGQDRQERKNLYLSHPEQVSQMQKRLDAIREASATKHDP